MDGSALCRHNKSPWRKTAYLSVSQLGEEKKLEPTAERALQRATGGGCWLSSVPVSTPKCSVRAQLT